MPMSESPVFHRLGRDGNSTGTIQWWLERCWIFIDFSFPNRDDSWLRCNLYSKKQKKHLKLTKKSYWSCPNRSKSCQIVRKIHLPWDHIFSCGRHEWECTHPKTRIHYIIFSMFLLYTVFIFKVLMPNNMCSFKHNGPSFHGCSIKKNLGFNLPKVQLLRTAHFILGTCSSIPLTVGTAKKIVFFNLTFFGWLKTMFLWIYSWDVQPAKKLVFDTGSSSDGWNTRSMMFIDRSVLRCKQVLLTVREGIISNIVLRTVFEQKS